VQGFWIDVDERFVGSKVLTAVVIKSSIFSDITLCSLLEVRVEEYDCLAYSLTLKMVAISSETSVKVQWPTRHHITEDRTLQNVYAL
jgi:hypothetical protein